MSAHTPATTNNRAKPNNTQPQDIHRYDIIVISNGVEVSEINTCFRFLSEAPRWFQDALLQIPPGDRRFHVTEAEGPDELVGAHEDPEEAWVDLYPWLADAPELHPHLVIL